VADDLFVTTNCGDDVPSGLQVLPDEVTFAFAIDTRQMDSILPLMKTETRDAANFGRTEIIIWT
jgi:hypothetical protein